MDVGNLPCEELRKTRRFHVLCFLVSVLFNAKRIEFTLMPRLLVLAVVTRQHRQKSADKNHLKRAVHQKVMFTFIVRKFMFTCISGQFRQSGHSGQ